MEGRPTRSRPTQRSSSWIGIVLVVALALGIWLVNGRDPGTGTSSGLDPTSGLPYVDLADLPDEARDTLELIDAGGPFPYDEDGATFGNYEGVLPERRRGYYAEYTVETPGLGHRGPLRIVVGSGDELYWTDDHYASFERIER